MARPDLWPEDAGQQEQRSGDQDHAQPAPMPEDSAREERPRGFLYPAVVVVGVLFLIILAAV